MDSNEPIEPTTYYEGPDNAVPDFCHTSIKGTSANNEMPFVYCINVTGMWHFYYTYVYQWHYLSDSSGKGIGNWSHVYSAVQLLITKTLFK